MDLTSLIEQAIVSAEPALASYDFHWACSEELSWRNQWTVRTVDKQIRAFYLLHTNDWSTHAFTNYNITIFIYTAVMHFLSIICLSTVSVPAVDLHLLLIRWDMKHESHHMIREYGTPFKEWFKIKLKRHQQVYFGWKTFGTHSPNI